MKKLLFVFCILSITSAFADPGIGQMKVSCDISHDDEGNKKVEFNANEDSEGNVRVNGYHEGFEVALGFNRLIPRSGTTLRVAFDNYTFQKTLPDTLAPIEFRSRIASYLMGSRRQFKVKCYPNSLRTEYPRVEEAAPQVSVENSDRTIQREVTENVETQIIESHPLARDVLRQ